MTQPKQLPHAVTEDWKGYTLDEIRYARAYTAARMELNRGRLVARFEGLGNTSFRATSPAGLVGKVLGAFSYLDMALIVWKVGRSMFRFTRAIKR